MINLENSFCTNLLILYGSQTGTAREVAYEIGRFGKRNSYDVCIYGLHEFSVEKLLRVKLALFVVSTAGQGQEPRNMTKFWKYLLRANLSKDYLSTLHFSVFGLGDSSYKCYNYVAKRLRNRLLQLGAHEIYSKGLGDDQNYNGFYGALMPWMDGVLKALHLSFPPPHGSQPMEPDILMEPFTKLTALTEDVELPNNFSNLLLKSENFVNAQATFSVNVVSNERTTKEHHFQEVRKIVFSIPETLSYTPGDLLLVQPENSMESVDYLIDFLGINANNRVTFSSPRKSPTLCTIRDLFTKYLDFNGRPTRYFFELLSHFATASHECEKLLELSLPANLEDLYAYAHRPRRTKLEVLRDFPTLRRRIPLEYVIDVFGWMEPRAFSICSSMKKHVGELHVCYAVVRYKTSLLLPRMGVCTNWMKSLESGFKVECCWVEPGTLRLPEDNSTTLLMIGPGTGVAPFRAFIEERSFEFNKTGCLVFGNRYKAQDYLFGEEWEEYINNGQLHVITAFSRDQELKVYVQHKIRENGRYIWNLINRGAYVYICGNARRMPEDVMNALMEVIQLFGPMTLKSAEEYVSRMRKERRLHTETW